MKTTKGTLRGPKGWRVRLISREYDWTAQTSSMPMSQSSFTGILKGIYSYRGNVPPSYVSGLGMLIPVAEIDREIVFTNGEALVMDCTSRDIAIAALCGAERLFK
jgi:hypothetical protein